MITNFDKYSIEETLKLIQEIYEPNKHFFIKMRKSKTIHRFLFSTDEIRIYTYAMIKNEQVIAVCIYIYDKRYKGLPLFSLSYAVEEKYRQKGLCSELIAKSLDYLQDELTIRDYYVATYVSMKNTVSQKLSRRFIDKNNTIIVDSVTGENQYRYLKLIKR